jgi:hypothetical protein
MADPIFGDHPRSQNEMSTDQPGKRSPQARWHKVLGVGASFVLLIFILVGVMPRFASYSGAWSHLTHLNTWWWVAIAVAAAINQISGIWPYQAALPGLRTRDGFLLIETAAAISNTVPAGGAVAIGMTYRMLSSLGFSGVDISTAVITPGIWNFAAKLGLPIAAVGLLSLTSHSTATVRGAALAGVVALLVAGAVLRVLFPRLAPTSLVAWPIVASTEWVTIFEGRRQIGSSARSSNSRPRRSASCTAAAGCSPGRPWPISAPGSCSC